jgi:hypothetical protein
MMEKPGDAQKRCPACRIWRVALAVTTLALLVTWLAAQR